MIDNKRGQGLSTNAIILIVLGVIVLVILIVGFTVGWEKIAPFLSSDNVDTIVNQCNTACATGSTVGFCSTERELKFSGELANLITKQKYTCNQLLNKDIGVKACSSVTCTLSCKDILDIDKATCNAISVQADCVADAKCEWI